MSDVALNRSTSLPMVALGLGIVAFVVYWGAGLATDGWGWILGAALGVVAVLVALVARRDADRAGRRQATIGLVLGAIPAVWFVGYLIVDAIA